MARPNFKYEKRQKELAKQKKQEEKRLRKLEKRNKGDEEESVETADIDNAEGGSDTSVDDETSPEGS